MVETVGSSRRNPSSCHFHSDWSASIPASSLSVKSVLLYDWWLVKNQNKQISVAGFSYRERFGARAFCSAPISRRIDTTTLETIDGIIITITGCINRTQTLQNGFLFSVCNNFDLGFPFDWEECVTKYYDEESTKCVSAEKFNFDELKVNSSISSGTEANSSQPLSFDNLPATRIRDLVLHMAESAESFAHDHIMGRVSDEEFQHSQEATKSELDKRCSKRGKTEQMYNNDDSRGFVCGLGSSSKNLDSRGFVCGLGSSSKNLGSKEELKFSVSSKNLRNKPVNEISADSTNQLSTPEANKIISEKVACTMKASSKQDKELKEAPDIPSVRRSGRLKIQKSYVGMAG